MNRISVTGRITFCLFCLLVSAILTADIFKLFPDVVEVRRADRARLCETLAINCSLLASQGDFRSIRANLEAVVQRHSEIRSASLRDNNQSLLAQAGETIVGPRAEEANRSAAGQVFVPIIANGKPWGTIEVRFTPLRQPGWIGFLQSPFLRFSTFVTALSLLLYYLFLRKTLRQLDPSRVVPDRVRSALDTLAEGLLVLDAKKNIALANAAFAEKVGREPADLTGKHVEELPWKLEANGNGDGCFPWDRPEVQKTLATGMPLALDIDGKSERNFMVNSAPVLAEDGSPRGLLASFDDVTELEAQRTELIESMKELRRSREEIQKQNHELQRLATRDSLTGCLNRRAFFEEFESNWSSAKRYGHPLACVLVDVDHFKSINDTYGHSVGDKVLRKVSDTLMEGCRKSDVVCRYGGEEFCVMLPFVDLAGARIAADKLRQAIEEMSVDKVKVTASFGVSTTAEDAGDPQELLDQADKCLYVAKRNGRNRVVCFNSKIGDEKVAPTDGKPEQTAAVDATIPFHAVSGLLAALSFRDAETAAHSTRVADLCVATSRGLMTASESYVVEMAALLHDIGKIGVPDSILLKPGGLSEDEWKIMKHHDRMGIEILRSSFASPRLAHIVETHHAHFGGRPDAPDLPCGQDIPLGARVLAIADAYDSMVSDRVYRKGRPPQEAFEELRKCAGTQFDPQLVERFISVVNVQLAVKSESCETTDKETAQRIGVQIERLAEAIDQHDYSAISNLAGMLQETGNACGVEDLNKAAAELKEAATGDPELRTVLKLAHQVMDLCRATRRAYIHAAQQKPQTNAANESRSNSDDTVEHKVEAQGSRLAETNEADQVEHRAEPGEPLPPPQIASQAKLDQELPAT